MVNLDLRKKRGQIAIYVIIAIAVVAGIVLLFTFRENLFGDNISPEFRPIYNLYEGCIEQEIQNGISILGTQGGRIDTGEFEVGSDFSPFSSHLNFLGVTVPYWYYISANGVIKEQAPSKNDMEAELETYLEENLNNCDFSQYYSQGFYIELPDEVNTDVSIEDERVVVNVNADLVSSIEDRSARKSNYKLDVESKLGKLYDLSRDIYQKEIDEAFLEEYAVDTLRLYAPVDGVDVQCNPGIWKTREVVDGIKSGLEANFGAIKFNGDYYELEERTDNYFVVDLNSDEPVNLIYSREWPSKIEVTPASDELMIADTVGTQQGLGILGFCYVPYHFVYDLSFPVLVRVGDGLEIFQFPFVVIVDNNLPREVNLISTEDTTTQEDICDLNVGDARIHTFDSNLNAVEADISYKCFDAVCNLGKTKKEGNDAFIDAKIPVCFNGQLMARADGYAEEKVLFSSNSETAADIILEREHEIIVDLEIDGVDSNSKFAVVHFTDDEGNVNSVVFPDSRTVKLKEGSYTIEAYAYSDSSITIPGTTKVQCVDVARKGLAGLFGATREECFNVNIPETKVDQALIGGGKTETYLLESELRKGNAIVNVGKLPLPRNLEELQYNFESFNGLGVDIQFR